MFSPTLKEFLAGAASKALATFGPEGVNVVPVSIMQVRDDGTLWLFDFFMDKTVKNIGSGVPVALTAWTALTGLQIKGTMRYVDNGPELEEGAAYVVSQNPSRVTRGVLVLTPTEIFDVSPGGVFKQEELKVT